MEAAMKQAALLIFISLFIFCVNHKTQKTSVAYPSIYIDTSFDYKDMTSDDSVCPGSIVTLTATVKDLDSKLKPSFKWEVTNGKILSGQGTNTINLLRSKEI